MKVVLFCGGLGTRLREHSETIPKPLVPVGSSPILLHLMRYYAHFGHTDFILCLGYKGELIRQFFLDHDPCLDEDFTLQRGAPLLAGGKGLRPADWNITFVDTGLHSNLGQRLLRVRDHLRGEPTFLANYSDQLSDLDLGRILDCHRRHAAVATFASVRPSQGFHTVDSDADELVTRFGAVQAAEVWINGGYMALDQSIFDYIQAGEELVEQPFQRLLQRQLLRTVRHTGFWAAMDTFKDKINLDRLDGREQRPWQVWERP
jgi:glucose-1-phosphate cytidylyltransferase